MTLREFLLKNAPRDEIPRRRWRDEWVAAVDVNQVRRYRNWVAHGRRTEQPAVVDPRTAYDRLSRFLQRLGYAELGGL